MTRSTYGSDLDLMGLTSAQETACRGALQAFLKRHDLASWGLSVILSQDGPRTWQLDISLVAPPELDCQSRSTQITVDETVDLEEVVDLYLEIHYNACMNLQAQRSNSVTARHFH